MRQPARSAHRFDGDAILRVGIEHSYMQRGPSGCYLECSVVAACDAASAKVIATALNAEHAVAGVSAMNCASLRSGLRSDICQGLPVAIRRPSVVRTAGSINGVELTYAKSNPSPVTSDSDNNSSGTVAAGDSECSHGIRP